MTEGGTEGRKGGMEIKGWIDGGLERWMAEGERWRQEERRCDWRAKAGGTAQANLYTRRKPEYRERDELMICVHVRRTEAKHLPDSRQNRTGGQKPSHLRCRSNTGGLWDHSHVICTNLRRRHECDFFTSGDIFPSLKHFSNV